MNLIPAAESLVMWPSCSVVCQFGRWCLLVEAGGDEATQLRDVTAHVLPSSDGVEDSEEHLDVVK